MLINAEIHHYHGVTNHIKSMRFLSSGINYFIRAKYCVDSIDKIAWELRYVDENHPDYVYETDSMIEDILNMTEEELFQASCVQRYDPFLIHSSMKEILKKILYKNTDNIINILLTY